MFGWIEKLTLGYSTAELQAESDKADASLRKINEDAHDRGAISDAVYAQTQENIANGQIDAAGAIGGAFKEGIAEGIDNERGLIGSTISFPFKFIPWQAWILGGALLFFYMGGAVWLKGIIPRKAK